MVDYNKILEVLSKRNKSQAWLYKRVGISNAGWNGMKTRNDMRVSDLCKIASVLKLHPSEL